MSAIRFYKRESETHDTLYMIDYIDARVLDENDINIPSDGCFYAPMATKKICQSLASKLNETVICEQYDTEPSVRITASFYLYPESK